MPSGQDGSATGGLAGAGREWVPWAQMRRDSLEGGLRICGGWSLI